MPHPRNRARQRGFTLVELLTVVVIVGVLATLAVFGVGAYIRSAKTAEAFSMMSSIKAAEEAYRAETFQYLDVSVTYDVLYPMTTPANKKWMWGGGSGTVPDNWRTLGVQSTSPVYFGYAVVAADPGKAVANPPTKKQFSFPAPNEPSYAVLAQGDLDGDGTFSYVVSHSFNAEVYVENEGE